MSGIRKPNPAWQVSIDGQDLTERFRPRLLELSLTEARGGEADQLDLQIHDHDGAIALPRHGAEIRVALGWEGQGLVDKGRFKVDESSHAGPPDIITVRARSADLTQQMRNRRSRSHHATTLGAVARKIASEHGLRASIAPELDRIALSHIDQSNESDVHFLTRLGQRFDAVATVKAGTLLLTRIGQGKTPSGIALPSPLITRADGDRHSWTAADREKYSGVSADWHDRQSGKKRTVTVGDAGNAKRMKRTYASETEARQHAGADWGRVQRGAGKLTLDLAFGRADIYPEQRLQVQGFKPEIDATTWLVARAVHAVTASQGFRTQLELESAL